MRPSRFSRTFLVLLAIVLAAVPLPSASQASGTAPESIGDFGTQAGFDAAAVDMSLDMAGKYAAVVARPAQGDIVAQSKHVYVFDIRNGQRVSAARYPFDSTGLETAPVAGGVVAMAANPSGASSFVVGAGHKVATYAVGSGTIAESRAFIVTTPTSTAPAGTVTAVAMNGDGSRVAAGVNLAAPAGNILANVTILDAQLKTLWIHQIPAKINAMALRGNVLAVAADNGIYLYRSLSIASGGQTISCTAANNCLFYQTGSTTNPVRVLHVALSANGQYLLAGTEVGQYLLFKTTEFPMVRNTAGSSADGAVRGLAMSGDAGTDPTRFAVVWNNGALRVYHHDPASSTVPVTVGYGATVPGDATAAPSSLSMGAAGVYVTVGRGAKVYGYTTAPAQGGAKLPSWTLDPGSSVVEAAITPDADRIAVATADRMFAYRQITKAEIIVKTFNDGRNELPLVGKQVVPGTIANYQFTLRNAGTTDDNYTFPWIVQPRAGWDDQRPSGFGLRAGEQRLVSLNITVPADASPGSYPFKLGVHSRLKNSLNTCGPSATSVCQIEFFANVTQVSKVVLTPTAGQARNFTVQREAPADFRIDVKNLGNARARVNLSLDQIPSTGGAWEVNFSKQYDIYVDGGKTATITATVTPPPNALNGAFTRLRVSALVNQTAQGAPLEFKALLNPAFGVSLSSEKPLEQLPGGKRTPIVVKVQNTGNTPATAVMSFSLTPRSALNSDWKIEAPTGTVELRDAGRTYTWTLYVQPLKEFPEQATITVNAVVRESENSTAPKKDEITINIERLPEDIPPTEAWYRRVLPAPGAAFVLLGLAALALAFRKR